MTLLWIDGFDDYGVNGGNAGPIIGVSGYTETGNAGFLGTLTNNTRSGVGLAMQLDNNSYGTSTAYLTRNFQTSAAIVVGMAVYITAGNYVELFRLGYDNYIGGVSAQIVVYYNNADGITVLTGDNGELYTSGPNVLFQNVWQFVEVMYTPGLAGTLQVKIDGTIVINVAAVNTKAAALPPSINFLTFPAVSGGGWGLVDDLYISDQLGTSFNTFLGDVVVHGILPNADAGPNTMGQVGGSVGHFTSVDEQLPDDDASYLFGSTSGLQEMFTLPAFPTDIIDVLAVAVNVRARKDTPGFAFLKASLAVAGVEEDGPVITLAQGYTMSQTMFISPPGGGVWSTAAAQAANIGFKVP